METPNQNTQEQLVKLELSVRDAQVVKAILEQQLMNSGMATYINVTNQLQGQIPDQPQPGMSEATPVEAKKEVVERKK